MGFIPHIELIKKHRFVIIAAALVFWLLMGLIVLLTEHLASTYFGAKPLDTIEQRQYLLRWIVWLIFTPAIMFLGLKINVGNCRLPWFVLWHFLLGTGILLVEFFIEYAVLHPMAESFYQRSVLLDEMAVPFLYKYFGYIVNYFLIVGVVNMYVYMNSLYATQQHLLQTELQNNELNYQLTLAQLHSLKMQIQPHFLFNTHQAILGLIALGENEKAAGMLTKLSDLLRSVIEKQDTEFVALSEEIATIDLYMDIQKIRFNDRLTFRKNVSPEALHMKIPYFILQPVVENAIQYGVEQSDENNLVQLDASITDQKLKIEVINQQAFRTDELKHGSGIGLSNIKKRLQECYGEMASFELTSLPSMQTKATLILPANEY